MINIAIDGPVGAGKSTLARKLAEKLGYIYVDTGALYRAIGLYALHNDVNTADAQALGFHLNEIRLALEFKEGMQKVFLNGADVSEEIRMPQVSMAASAVSAHPEIRAFLLDMQRNMAKKQNVVMDGRDIGTVILPDAQIKIFLTASAEERARRRFLELQDKGMDISFNQVLNELKERDYKDSTRKEAPLKQAEDAILVDTTGISLEAALDYLMKIVEAKRNEIV